MPGRLTHGDGLTVMRCMASNSVDLIATDPPYMSGKKWSSDAGTFDDRWTAANIDPIAEADLARQNPLLGKFCELLKEMDGPGASAYATYMARRIIEMHRVLKPTGTLYLQCDQVANHYLKTLLSTVFGRKNFISEIIWRSSTSSGFRAAGKKPVKVHDNLLVYTKVYGNHVYNRLFTEHSDATIKRHNLTDDDGRKYFKRKRGNNHVVQYLDKMPGVPVSSVWADIPPITTQHNNKEKTGYPTQKPLALLKRIIEASSNKGDLVFDPFCGSGTTLVAAKMLGRGWAGCDTVSDAIRTAEGRLDKLLSIRG